MKMRGALFHLQCLINGNYEVVAACRSHTMNIDNESVDVSDKSNFWRELLEHAGITSISVKAQGVASTSATYEFIRQSVISASIIPCKLVSYTDEIYSGNFQFSSFDSSGEYSKEEIFALSLDSSGSTDRIDNDFLLLEDGGYLLLEDGGRIILEAA